MSAPLFRFQRFTVCHDRSSMPVGTDGVLLGAWAPLEGAARVLDVGCGCGLIALMAAQRAEDASIVGIDVDASSVAQARENVAASPFSRRITILEQDVRQMDADDGFDHILCNPPFHVESTLPPIASRMVARNTTFLPFSDLVSSVVRLLAPGGCFSVVLPVSAHEGFVSLCLACGLRLSRQCLVQTVPSKPPKRVLLCFRSKSSAQDKLFDGEASCSVLVLQNPDGSRSEAYHTLTCDFYLPVS